MRRNAFRCCFHLMLVGLAFLILGASGCGPSNSAPAAQKSSLPLVQFTPVETSDLETRLLLSGNAVADRSAVITSLVEGRVSDFSWQEGDTVEAGTLLFQVERELYQRDVDAAKALWAVEQARLEDMNSGTRPEEIAKTEEELREAIEKAELAEREKERIVRLQRSGSVTQELLDKVTVEAANQRARVQRYRHHLDMLRAGQTTTEIAIQQAKVEEALARLRRARSLQEETRIYAPFSGVIRRLHVHPGDSVTLRATLLELHDPQSVHIHVDVPEQFSGLVEKAASVAVQLDALPNRRFAAVIQRVYPDLDARLRTRRVVYRLDGEDRHLLLPGMFARVELILERRLQVPTVPRTALRMIEGKSYLCLADDGKIRLQPVVTGLEDHDRIELREGPSPGTLVASAGHQKLKNGSPFQVQTVKKATGGPTDKRSDGQTDGKKVQP